MAAKRDATGQVEPASSTSQDLVRDPEFEINTPYKAKAAVLNRAIQDIGMGK